MEFVVNGYVCGAYSCWKFCYYLELEYLNNGELFKKGL